MLAFASVNAVGPTLPIYEPGGPNLITASAPAGVFSHSFKARSALTKDLSISVTLSTSLVSLAVLLSSITKSIVTPSYDLSLRIIEPDSTNISEDTCCNTSVLTPLPNKAVKSCGVSAA